MVAPEADLPLERPSATSLSDGLVAERLRSGLQIRVLGFESRPGLQRSPVRVSS